MNAMIALVMSHPEFSAAVLWPVLTAILSVLFKSRTPEQYAETAQRQPVWFFARLAAFWQLIGALGLDPVKATEALKKVLSGKVEKR